MCAPSVSKTCDEPCFHVVPEVDASTTLFDTMPPPTTIGFPTEGTANRGNFGMNAGRGYFETTTIDSLCRIDPECDGILHFGSQTPLILGSGTMYQLNAPCRCVHESRTDTAVLHTGQSECEHEWVQSEYEDLNGSRYGIGITTADYIVCPKATETQSGAICSKCLRHEVTTVRDSWRAVYEKSPYQQLKEVLDKKK